MNGELQGATEAAHRRRELQADVEHAQAELAGHERRRLRSMSTPKRLHYLGHMAGYNLAMVDDEELEKLVLGLPSVLNKGSTVVARLLQSLMQARGEERPQ